MTWSVECADVLEWAAGYEGPKFHALLTDSPYEMAFMNRNWDQNGVSFQPETWAALAAHLYPGAFGMSFASARGWHRLAVAIEDAGLIIHPSIFMLGYIQGQGFPKATRVKVNGKEPKEWSQHRYGLQAMKPSLEPIIVFQKPYSGKPSECITATGAGALWIDGGRVSTNGNDANFRGNRGLGRSAGGWYGEGEAYNKRDEDKINEYQQHSGRWPPNVCLTHAEGCKRVGTRRVRGVQKAAGCIGFGPDREDSYEEGTGRQYAPEEIVEAWSCVEECPVEELGEQSGERPSGGNTPFPDRNYVYSGEMKGGRASHYKETGTAARFYPNHDWQYEIAERLAGVTPFRYVAKAARKERDAGLEGFAIKDTGHRHGKYRCKKCNKLKLAPNPCICNNPDFKRIDNTRNPHPTVKPVKLCQWLATLLLPPPEYAPRRILVPFAGSGSEMIGCGLAGWDEIVGVEMEPEYVEISEARLRFWAGWAERGYDDPKAILAAAKKEEKKREKAQMELEL